jgi:hypothetical protein
MSEAREEAEQAAENLLLGLEKYARELGIAVHLLGTFRVDYDDLAIQQKVEVRRAIEGEELRYYATDGWGNVEHSTREWVKLRIAQHLERQLRRPAIPTPEQFR